jgi:short-subunit dehydrogenase
MATNNKIHLDTTTDIPDFESLSNQRAPRDFELQNLYKHSAIASLLLGFLYVFATSQNFWSVGLSWDWILKVLGVSVLVKGFFALACGVWEVFYLKGKNLTERYGNCTYAVITGGSDGLGWSMAKALAGKGFSIVLVARNETRLTARCAVLMDMNAGIIAQYIVADFSKGTTTEFYEKIFDQLKDLPISILVNNVGIGHVAVSTGFDVASTQNVLDQTLINMVPQVLMTKILFQKLSTRANHKSIIIDIGSLASFNEILNEDLYSANKTFNRAFTACMHEKFGLGQSNIEWLSFKPGFILTSFGDTHQYSVKKMFRGKSDSKFCFTPD